VRARSVEQAVERLAAERDRAAAYCRTHRFQEAQPNVVLHAAVAERCTHCGQALWEVCKHVPCECSLSAEDCQACPDKELVCIDPQCDGYPQIERQHAPQPLAAVPRLRIVREE
jgi:hypothetical protein